MHKLLTDAYLTGWIKMITVDAGGNADAIYRLEYFKQLAWQLDICFPNMEIDFAKQTYKII